MTIKKKYGNAFKNPAKTLYSCLPAIVLMLIANCCKAQLNPFQAIYYQNRYLNNPAMAGFDNGLTVYTGYQQQWDAFPGQPKSSALTAEYQATDKVGIGINITDDQSGLFRQTRILGTYAYHLPLDDDKQKLNFGLSLGVNDSRINYGAVIGDPSDMVLLQYNQTKPNVDGDFGLSYSSNSLFMEAVLPNLSTTIFNRAGQGADVDRTVFFTAVSYKIDFNNEVGDFSLEPLIAYRQVKGYTNIFDAGLNFMMNDFYNIGLQTIYHSNDNFSIGLIFDQENYTINFDYNIYSGPITNYANGNFELGIKLKLFKPGKN